MPIQLEKISLSYIQILKTVNTLTPANNLRQSIQMQLSQKQKIFSRFVSVFLKSILKFENF